MGFSCLVSPCPISRENRPSGVYNLNHPLLALFHTRWFDTTDLDSLYIHYITLGSTTQSKATWQGKIHRRDVTVCENLLGARTRQGEGWRLITGRSEEETIVWSNTGRFGDETVRGGHERGRKANPRRQVTHRQAEGRKRARQSQMQREVPSGRGTTPSAGDGG